MCNCACKNYGKGHKLKEISYEQIILAQEGNEDANNLIYNVFKPLIVKKAKNAIFGMHNRGVDIDDIMQEGYIGLEEAIKNYSQDADTSFYTFAMICIERQISNYVRGINNNKGKILNEAVIIDEGIEKIIPDNTDIENSVVGKDYNIKLINNIWPTLTYFEKKVLDLKLDDYSLDEMSQILKKDKKAIYNAIQRIKIKFRKFGENDN